MLLSLNIAAQNTASKCYRGYTDVGYSFDLGDYEFGRFEINTTHGYQFSPYFFLGAGLGLHFASEYKTPDMEIPLDIRESKVDIPLFADVHINFLKKKVTPFFDLKAGTYVNNNGGEYICASVGCRFAINSKQAINLIFGYASEKLEFETFEKFTSKYNLDYTRKSNKLSTEVWNLRLGFEF